jgi:hypothetical protein
MQLKCSSDSLINGQTIKRGQTMDIPKSEARVLLSSNRFVLADSPEAAAIEAKKAPAAPASKKAKP